MTPQEKETIAKQMSQLLAQNPDLIRSLEAQGIKTGGIVKTPLDTALDNFVTTDYQMLMLKEKAKLYSTKDYPCLIEGATGTGKELIARILHGNRAGNFVAINCSALPTTLLESILFGHTAGSFTGAKDKEGLVAKAENGTLFLDEIGDMPIELQAKLLRVIQNKTYRKLGDGEEKTTNTRFIAATHSVDKIRLDLYFRLSALHLVLKPLCERPCDIIPIARELARKYSIVLTAEIEERLTNGGLYLRGNVRELENRLIQLSIA